jgi:hypothetical protein
MSGRTQAQSHSDMLNQMNNTVGILSYWKEKATPDRAWLLGIAIQMLERVAKDIYDNELVRIARLEE